MIAFLMLDRKNAVIPNFVVGKTVLLLKSAIFSSSLTKRHSEWTYNRVVSQPQGIIPLANTLSPSFALLGESGSSKAGTWAVLPRLRPSGEEVMQRSRPKDLVIT